MMSDLLARPSACGLQLAIAAPLPALVGPPLGVLLTLLLPGGLDPGPRSKGNSSCHCPTCPSVPSAEPDLGTVHCECKHAAGTRRARTQAMAGNGYTCKQAGYGSSMVCAGRGPVICDMTCYADKVCHIRTLCLCNRYGYDYPCTSGTPSVNGGVCEVKAVPFAGAPCSDAAGSQRPFSEIMACKWGLSGRSAGAGRNAV